MAQVSTVSEVPPAAPSGGAEPTNLTQINGVAVDTNSGNKSAGTQRVVLATDQPNLTTPLNTQEGGVADAVTTTSTLSAAGVIVGPIDCTAYQAAAFVITNNGGGSTFVLENSVDNSTWQASFFIPANGMSSQTVTTSTATAGTNYTFPIISRYYRIRISSYVSGTASVTINLRKIPLQAQVIQLAGVTAVNAGADAVSNTQVGIPVYSRSEVYNGTNWDRSTSIVGALAAGSTGVGTAAIEATGTPFSQITTGTSTTVKGTPGVLHRVTVNTPVASATIKIYNALSATGTPITITIPSTVTGESPFFIDYDIYMSTGIFVVTSTTTDVTVAYR